jgi:hypothetical protein
LNNSTQTVTAVRQREGSLRETPFPSAVEMDEKTAQNTLLHSKKWNAAILKQY